MTRRRQTQGQLVLPLGDGLLSPDQRRQLAGRIEPNWQHRAACLDGDPETWFPDDTDTRTRSEAVRVCRTCPVLGSCRAAGILGDEHGIWGGATKDQRRVLAERVAYGADLVDVLDRDHPIPPVDADSGSGVAA